MDVAAQFALRPPGGDGKPPAAGSGEQQPHFLLVVLHAPEHGSVATKLEVNAPVFALGTKEDDLTIEGATASQTHAEIVWEPSAESPSKKIWRLKGAGRLFVNGRATTDCDLRSGDEVRIVDSFFRFLTGPKTDEQYHQTIYQSTIQDFPTGSHNPRYLSEVLFRERARAKRYEKPFSVAVIMVEADPDQALVHHDLLRPLVRKITESSPRDWVIARTSDSELTVVAPESESTLASFLEKIVPSCLPPRTVAKLGVIVDAADIALEQLVPCARRQFIALD